MKNSPVSVIIKYVYIAVLTVMFISGFGQMPIFKRYYIADIPGMAWTADFFITSDLHNFGAVILIILFAFVLVEYFLILRKSYRLTAAGYVRTLLLGLLIVSGLLLFVSNMRGVYFGQTTLIVLDLIHVTSTFALLTALLIFAIKKSGWIEIKSELD